MHKFNGKEGEFVAGLPAHDIDDDDYATLTDEQKDLLKAHMKTDSPLYEKVKVEDKDDKADKGKKPSGSVDGK